jgi:DNA-binding NtrC family response regulator
VTIELPPLRARSDDIPLLVEQHVRRLAHKYKWPQLAISPEALRVFCDQSWPGNIREMHNVLARAAILSRGRVILSEDLSATGMFNPSPSPPPSPGLALSLKEILAETERRVIQHALEQVSWNRTKASLLLGISRRQLFDKIRQYGLKR